jgi:hypothetical protein
MTRSLAWFALAPLAACNCDAKLTDVTDQDSGAPVCAVKGQPCSLSTGPCGSEGTLDCPPDGGTPICVGVVANPANACGGCATLAGKPGDTCGKCGTYGCISANDVVCSDPGVNACGGCARLSGKPGASCGTCGTYACNGTDAVSCGGDTPNGCGGCSALTANPGDPCSVSGLSGTWQCSGPDSLTCVTTSSNCVVFTNPDFCPSSAGWVPTIRWGYEYAALESGPPCVAHGLVEAPDAGPAGGGTWPSPGYGVSTFVPAVTQKLCVSPASYVCVDYETPAMAGLGGACGICDGTGGYEDCVANLGAGLTFYDGAGNVLSQAFAGPRTWGIGDTPMPNATAAGSMTSDSVVYDLFTCTKSGTPKIFLHAEDPSRHHFRAKVSQLVPAGEQPVAVTWEVGHSYPNDPPSEPTEMKVYSAFLGTPDTPAFCTCLGGNWNGSSCLGI